MCLVIWLCADSKSISFFSSLLKWLNKWFRIYFLHHKFWMCEIGGRKKSIFTRLDNQSPHRNWIIFVLRSLLSWLVCCIFKQEKKIASYNNNNKRRRKNREKKTNGERRAKKRTKRLISERSEQPHAFITELQFNHLNYFDTNVFHRRSVTEIRNQNKSNEAPLPPHHPPSTHPNHQQQQQRRYIHLNIYRTQHCTKCVSPFQLPLADTIKGFIWKQQQRPD